jgi:peptidoglycan/LPS O-acetylase OafA/YrhL
LLTLIGATLGYPLFSLGCALILAAALEWERVFGAWRVPGAGAIAILSYSLYLTHKLVIHADQALLGADNLVGVGGFAVYFATSIGAATLLWIAVERPFLRLRDRILNK